MVIVKRTNFKLGVFLMFIGLAQYPCHSLMAEEFDDVRFGSVWSSMQKSYIAMSQELDKNELRYLEKTYYHSYWETAKENVAKMLIGSTDCNFLSLPAIAGSMVVGNYDSTYNKKKAYEIAFLKDFPSKRVIDLIASYQEPAVGPRLKESKELNCSANALHLLCYAAKILDLCEAPENIVEFGSGYGCLAHIFKQLVPNCTLFLIDIPELLAIQYLYLQYAFPQATIVVHSQEKEEEFQKGAIHLIPVHFLKDLNINADVFVSTFAISESPMCVQKIVCDKRFFGANTLYITGQLHGWNHMFEDHSSICSAARYFYNSMYCMPYYYTLGTWLESYELIALNQR